VHHSNLIKPSAYLPHIDLLLPCVDGNCVRIYDIFRDWGDIVLKIKVIKVIPCVANIFSKEGAGVGGNRLLMYRLTLRQHSH
jgi:hypothetical protein